MPPKRKAPAPIAPLMAATGTKKQKSIKAFFAAAVPGSSISITTTTTITLPPAPVPAPPAPPALAPAVESAADSVEEEEEVKEEVEEDDEVEEEEVEEEDADASSASEEDEGDEDPTQDLYDFRLLEAEQELVAKLVDMRASDPAAFAVRDWSTPLPGMTYLKAECGVGFIHARTDDKKVIRWNLICAVFNYMLEHACSLENVPAHMIAEPIGGVESSNDPAPSNWVLRPPRILKTFNNKVHVWSNGKVTSSHGHTYSTGKGNYGRVQGDLGKDVQKLLGKKPQLHNVVSYAYFGKRAPKGSTHDHANQKPRDNRIDNLRAATSSDQKLNRTIPPRVKAVWHPLTPGMLDAWTLGVFLPHPEKEKNENGEDTEQSQQQTVKPMQHVTRGGRGNHPLYFNQSLGELIEVNERKQTFKRRPGSLQKESGYCMHQLAGRNIRVHRLIAVNVPALAADVAEFERRGERWIGNHMDGNKEHNHPNNLEVVTDQGNVAHAIGRKTQAMFMRLAYQGGSISSVARQIVATDSRLKEATVISWLMGINTAPAHYGFSCHTEDAFLQKPSAETSRLKSNGKKNTYTVSYYLGGGSMKGGRGVRAIADQECWGKEGIKDFIKTEFNIDAKPYAIFNWIGRNIPEQYNDKIVSIVPKNV